MIFLSIRLQKDFSQRPTRKRTTRRIENQRGTTEIEQKLLSLFHVSEKLHCTIMKSRISCLRARVARNQLTKGTSIRRNRLSSLSVPISDLSSPRYPTRVSCFRFLSTTEDGSGRDDEVNNVSDDEIGEGEEFDEAAYEKFEDSEDHDEFEDDDNNYFERQPSKEHSDKKIHEESSNRRIWLDPSTPLEDRVNRFVNRKLGALHPLDTILASVDLIRECGKMNSFEGMKYAHDVLDRILEEKRHVNQSGPSPIVISEKPFKVLMYGWSNLCRTVPVAPQRMREVLDMMILEAEYDDKFRAEHQSTPIPFEQQSKKLSEQEPEHMFASMSCQPTVDIYSTLLSGLVQASFRSIAAAGEAEQALNSMDRMHRKRGWHTKPNTKSFALVINAFAKTRHPTGGDRAEVVLRKMIKCHEQEKELYHEETGTAYNILDPSSNKRRIVTPDTIAYSSVIQAHALSETERSAEKALALLTELIQSPDPNLTPDAFVFANTINAFARMAAKKKTASARLAAAESAEDILWLMVEEFKPEETEPTEGDDRDESKAIPSHTSVVPFNACLNAWAQSNTPESPRRAEELLQKMLDPELTHVQPNTGTFNACLQAWAKAARSNPKAPEKAEELLNLLESVDAVQPDATSYATVMNAFAQSNRNDKALQARRLLESLLSNRQTMKITAVPFTILLNAVAYSRNMNDISGNAAVEDVDVFVGAEELEDPYSIALETYSELRDDTYNLGIIADHLAFATMLDVIRQHTDAESIERRQRVEGVFEDACAAGEVSSMVVQALTKACPSTDMLQALLRTRKKMQSVNALRREWTRNVGPKFIKLRSDDGNKKREWRAKRKNPPKQHEKKKENRQHEKKKEIP